MLEHGSPTIELDASGRVLDRLAGLEQAISSEAVKQSLAATGRVGKRNCKLSHQVMLWIVRVLCPTFKSCQSTRHGYSDELYGLGNWH